MDSGYKYVQDRLDYHVCLVSTMDYYVNRVPSSHVCINVYPQPNLHVYIIMNICVKISVLLSV